MLAVIAIVGRPNVGKSTLFNRITKSRDAIVADQPGMTRDRKYGEAVIDDKKIILVDTGGIGEEETGIDDCMTHQSLQAMQEATKIIFLVDAQAGLMPGDQTIAKHLRQLQKPIYVVVNKVDGFDEDLITHDFYQLGLGEPFPVSAEHKRGVSHLMEDIVADLPATPDTLTPESGIKFAIIGRPNVGKSTLTNRILGEERVIVFDEPGTTRDSIYIPFDRREKRYTVIDTAGVRRRARVNETVEKFSVIKTLQAISDANVVVVLLDAQAEVANQDLSLIGYALHAGKAMVIAINKWDNLDQEQRAHIKKELERKLTFVDFADMHFISALHGTCVGDLFQSIDVAYEAATKDLSTSALTRVLERAIFAHQPPLVGSRRVKLRYAHAGGKNPPLIVVHGNQVEVLPRSYKRYLENTFRKAFNLRGTPVRMQFNQGDNPFKDQHNILTPRQKLKRQRLMKHVKKSKR